MMMVLPDEDGPNSFVKSTVMVRTSPATDISTFFMSVPPVGKAARVLSWPGRRHFGFGAKSRHQPFGLILPPTSLQPSGGTNCRHFSQSCPFLGVSWYWTCCLVAFCCASAVRPSRRNGPTRATGAIMPHACSTRRREILHVMVEALLPSLPG